MHKWIENKERNDRKKETSITGAINTNEFSSVSIIGLCKS
jgi:hypothetical protein